MSQIWMANNKMKAIFLCTLLQMALCPLFAQGPYQVHAFGKISKKDFVPIHCPIDSQAGAWYVFDAGQASIISSANILKLQFTRHFRIKIKDRSHIYVRNIKIPLQYGADGMKDEITDLRATTYNIIQDKVVPSKLDKKSISRTSVHTGQDIIEFRMPDAKAGSILEVKYTVLSDYLTKFQPWDFQHEMPTLVSSFTTHIPSYFEYHEQLWGHLSVSTTRLNSTNYLLGTDETINYYEIQNSPAIKEEPFVLNPSLHGSRIEYELACTRFESGFKPYAYSWEYLDSTLWRHPYFGGALRDSLLFTTIADSLKRLYTHPEDLLSAAYHYIKKTIHRTNATGLYASGPLSRGIAQHTGNVADINLSLILLLKTLGFNSSPAILSTAEVGLLIPDFPSLAQANYVLASVRSDDRTLFLDASDPYVAYQMLPPKCQHGLLRIMIPGQSQWHELKQNRLAQVKVRYTLKLDPYDGFTGTYEEQNFNYAGYQMRKDLADSTGLSNYIDHLQQKFLGLGLKGAYVMNMQDPEQNLIIGAAIKTRLWYQEIGDTIRILPVYLERIMSNPFKASSRLLPIEYDFPWMTIVDAELKIPESYSIAQLPKAALIQSDDKSSKYTILTQIVDPGTISIKSAFSIHKAMFLPENHGSLRQFYDLVMNKQAEKIVIVKKF